MCWSRMPLNILCFPEDVGLLQKHVREFMCVINLWFHVKAVHLLAYMDDYVYNQFVISKVILLKYIDNYHNDMFIARMLWKLLS
jgi:hypothetical protein